MATPSTMSLQNMCKLYAEELDTAYAIYIESIDSSELLAHWYEPIGYDNFTYLIYYFTYMYRSTRTVSRRKNLRRIKHLGIRTRGRGSSFTSSASTSRAVTPVGQLPSHIISTPSLNGVEPVELGLPLRTDQEEEEKKDTTSRNDDTVIVPDQHDAIPSHPDITQPQLMPYKQSSKGGMAATAIVARKYTPPTKAAVAAAAAAAEVSTAAPVASNGFLARLQQRKAAAAAAAVSAGHVTGGDGNVGDAGSTDNVVADQLPPPPPNVESIEEFPTLGGTTVSSVASSAPSTKKVKNSGSSASASATATATSTAVAAAAATPAHVPGWTSNELIKQKSVDSLQSVGSAQSLLTPPSSAGMLLTRTLSGSSTSSYYGCEYRRHITQTTDSKFWHFITLLESSQHLVENQHQYVVINGFFRKYASKYREYECLVEQRIADLVTEWTHEMSAVYDAVTSFIRDESVPILEFSETNLFMWELMRRTPFNQMVINIMVDDISNELDASDYEIPNNERKFWKRLMKHILRNQISISAGVANQSGEDVMQRIMGGGGDDDVDDDEDDVPTSFVDMTGSKNNRKEQYEF